MGAIPTGSPTLLRCCALLAGTVMVASARARAAPATTLDDAHVTEAIEDEFLFDRSVPLNRIDIATSDGIVTLSGQVGNLLAKERAVRLAETVRGVRAVIDRIHVQPHTVRSDAEIRKDIESALLYDPATQLTQLNVAVRDGVATLMGTVDSWQERELVLEAVRGVRGVKGVNDSIAINYQPGRPDGEIEPEIRKILQWDPLVDDALIHIAVSEGKVTLTGTVGSAAEKRRTRYDAWVAGVKTVDDSGLEVKRWARDEDLRENKYTLKPDSDVKAAVQGALLRDPRVMSSNISVDVAAGTATLRGIAENLKAERAAETDARNTVGVTEVRDRLKVRPAVMIPDATIAEDVREALARDPLVNRYDIQVSVIDGVVYLNGIVNSYFEKAQADDVASRAAGVVAVENNLDVEQTHHPLVYEPYVYPYYPYSYPWYDYQPYHTFMTDQEIRNNIENELWWSPFVDADEVSVSVKGGVATLTGVVDTRSAYHAATENAYEGGATWVVNDLTVR